MSHRASIQLDTSDAEPGVHVLRVSASIEGAALIEAGRWLEQRAHAGTIEDIDWALSDSTPTTHTLILTLSESPGELQSV